MSTEKLKIEYEPKSNKPPLVIGLSGWMNGGDVSTGTIKYLRKKLGAVRFANIRSGGFYIYNFPGSMEISALFRPHTKMKDGLIQKFDLPTNIFYYSEEYNIALFSGKEPNLAWEQYASCIFELCKKFDIDRIFFVGSVAGLTPHTREPRITCSVSDENLKKLVPQPGMKFSEYEGPASIITYMTSRAQSEGISMLSMVVEIPAYVQGYNPRCIESATRYISRFLDLQLNLDDLRQTGDEYERKLSEIVQQQPELAKKVIELEADYDNRVFDTQMGDLKDWLEQKGIRMD